MSWCPSGSAVQAASRASAKENAPIFGSGGIESSPGQAIQAGGRLWLHLPAPREPPCVAAVPTRQQENDTPEHRLGEVSAWSRQGALAADRRPASERLV